MQPLNNPEAIIDFCLAPLNLDTRTEAEREVRRRLEHVIKTFRARLAQPVAVDFSEMPLQVINEAAHGQE
ncbi:hypothetical protein GCM10009422_24710 [Brevundimonas kwangchunensis]|uniref:Uncharacterized protein n=1 Tax=Brevundimonas kwangchunensis TaxID=322163 RepID=A0ABN1H240_9CAUL